MSLSIKGRLKLLLNNPLGYVLTWIVAFGIIYLCGRNAARYIEKIQDEQRLSLLLNVSALTTVIIAMVMITSGFRISHFSNYSKKSLLITAAVSLGLFIISAILIRQSPGSVPLILVNGLLLIILSFTIGEMLSREVVNSGHLVPVAVVLAIVDFWSVSLGPSKKIAQQVAEFAGKEGYSLNLPPPWMSFLLLRFPQFLMREIYSFVGIGDLVIIAFFIGCIHRFKLPVIASYSSLILGTALAMLIANLLEKALPVLPVIALLFLVINFRYLSMKRSDIAVSAIAIAFIIAVIIMVNLFR